MLAIINLNFMIMKPSKRFQDLIVWQRAHQFVLCVYQLTSGFPKDEIFGLTFQFRKAAVSIAANIAEGFIKRTKPDKIRFFNIAQGSLEECCYYIILSRDLEYGVDPKLEELYEEISRLLNAYINAIES
jgi:four helix bundle protein